MLRRYAQLSGDDINSTEFVLRSLSKSKNGNYCLCRARDFFIVKLKAIDLDTKLYGLHSLRIGEASAAANNNVPDPVIKKHGMWKSEKAKGTYCRKEIQHQLLVTLNIAI